MLNTHVIWSNVLTGAILFMSILIIVYRESGVITGLCSGNASAPCLTRIPFPAEKTWRSWFPVVYPQYLVKPTDYQFCIWFLPLRRGDDACFIARNSCRSDEVG